LIEFDLEKAAVAEADSVSAVLVLVKVHCLLLRLQARLVRERQR